MLNISTNYIYVFPIVTCRMANGDTDQNAFVKISPNSEHEIILVCKLDLNLSYSNGSTRHGARGGAVV
jgi:hypothetical protein